MRQSTEMGQAVLEAVRKVTYCDRGPDGTCVWSLGQRPDGTGSEAVMWKWPTVTEARRNRFWWLWRKWSTVTEVSWGRFWKLWGKWPTMAEARRDRFWRLKKVTHCDWGQTGQVLETVRKVTHCDRGPTGKQVCRRNTYIPERNWRTRCHLLRPVPSYPVLHCPSLAASDAGYDGGGDARGHDCCSCSLSARKKLGPTATAPPS